MEEFKYQPAADIGLAPGERPLSLKREAGLISSTTRHAYYALMRAYLTTYHRLTITGRDNIPGRGPFVMIANHASHLDAMVMAVAAPSKLRNTTFPLAAGDVFFETPVVANFAMLCVNALPLWRNNCGRHALNELRTRLIEEPCAFILFPEGRRSPDGNLLEFKAGLGMIVCETEAPVIPCYLNGAHRALPRTSKIPRPAKLSLAIGEPLRFSGVPNKKAGWKQVADETRRAVVALSAGELS